MGGKEGGSEGDGREEEGESELGMGGWIDRWMDRGSEGMREEGSKERRERESQPARQI